MSTQILVDRVQGVGVCVVTEESRFSQLPRNMLQKLHLHVISEPTKL